MCADKVQVDIELSTKLSMLNLVVPHGQTRGGITFGDYLGHIRDPQVVQIHATTLDQPLGLGWKQQLDQRIQPGWLCNVNTI